MLPPQQLRALLRCPVCHSDLVEPTTLLCGHSLCSEHLHVPSASCPLRPCTTSPNSRDHPPPPRIPPQSSVRYHPPPQHHRPPQPLPTPHRPDVVLNNLINLAARSSTPTSDSPNSDDDDDDDDHRPRKRHKHVHHDDEHDQDDLLSHLRSSAARDRLVHPDVPLISDHSIPRDSALQDYDKKLLEELTCHICYLLFYQPVTTPCQHTFCAKCIQRSIDHSSKCPICRDDIPTTYFQDHPVNNLLLSIILNAYPLLYRERGDAIEEEERHARINTPIFQATLAFPGIPTLLHIYEPKYRLMLRRCLESPHPCFGMIMPQRAGAPETNYGTMLEIRSVQMLADGRSMVETWGISRFRILDRATLDGYMVGRIERIDDYPDDFTEALVDNPVPPVPTRTPTPTAGVRHRTSPTASSSSSSSSTSTRPAHSPYPTNEELISTCKSFIESIKRGTAPWVVQRLSTTYLVMPTDPALFAFWVAHVLPIEDDEKAKMLPIRSARLRLLLAVHWIEQLNNNWYATSSWSRLFMFQQRMAHWLFAGPVPLLFPLLMLIWFFVSSVFWSGNGAADVAAAASGLDAGFDSGFGG